MLTAVALLVTATAASGCGRENPLRDLATKVAQPSGRTTTGPVDTPDANLANDPVVATAKSSVVMIRGLANACQKVLQGSGFVVAPNRVMSNAHVVAGADSVSVEVDGISYDAQVVSYDPNIDISILDVPNLTAQPLAFADSSAESGTDALVLGYPDSDSIVATPARIRETDELQGPDIYRTTTVTREVYNIRGIVKQGSSGGPLIDMNARVLGVVFGAGADDPDLGFALTSNEVAPEMAQVGNTAPVATGGCIG